MKDKNRYLLGVSDNAFITAQGLNGLGFEVDLMEYSTQTHTAIDEVKNSIVKALNLMKDNVFVVKMDFMFEDTYKPTGGELGFFQKKANDYFTGKPFLNHKAYLFFVDMQKEYTLKVLQNPLEMLPVKKISQELEKGYVAFTEGVNNFISSLSSKGIQVRSMKGEDIENFLQVYFACGRTNILPSVDFKNQKIDNKFYSVYSINDENCFPNLLSYYNKNETLSTVHDNYYSILGDDLGFNLRHEHVYVQTFLKKSKEQVQKTIDKRRSVFSLLKGMTAGNDRIIANMDKLDADISKNDTMMVSGNVSLVSFANTKEALEKCNVLVRKILNDRGFRFRELSRNLQNHLFVCSHPFFVSQIGSLNLFDVDASAVLSLWNFSTNYRNEFGNKSVYLCDRFNLPVAYDLWDEYKKKHEAKNILIVGPTGSSKSTTMSHLLKQFVELDFNLLVVDIGRSYEKIALILGEKALLVRLKPNAPLSINPFMFVGGRGACLLVDNLTFLTEYFMAHCGLYGEEVMNATTTYFRYFSSVLKIFLSLSLPLDFKHLIEWFVQHYETLPYENEDIKDVLSSDTGKKELDVKNYVSILKQFVKGGTYGNIYQGEQALSLEGKRLVVFEVEEVKDNPLLYNLFTLAISFVAQKTIWLRKDIPGYYIIDEFQTMAQKKGVLQTTASQYQRARKHSAGMAICLQDFTAVETSPYFRSIINNTAIKIILDHRGQFDLTAKTLGLNEFQRYVVGSVQNKTRSDVVEKYASMMILHGNYCKVFHNHLDPYSYFAAITDGEENALMLEKLNKGEDVHLMLNNLIREKHINTKPYAV